MLLAAAASRTAALRVVARAAPVTTQAGRGKGAGGSTTATGAGTGYAAQDWMTRSSAAGERAEKAAEGAMTGEGAPEFGLHRAGLGFDLSALADAIRSSWGGRAPQAAMAVAKMVSDPHAARRVPFPPPQQHQQAKAAKGEGEGEGKKVAKEQDDDDDMQQHLPLRWRRMTPDAANDEWYEIKQ